MGFLGVVSGVLGGNWGRFFGGWGYSMPTGMLWEAYR